MSRFGIPPRSDGRPAGRSIAILGAGAAGLCMAMRLKQCGIRDFTIFEKGDRVGGTWRDNTYPGAGCDVPSHLYSFSFEPNLEWSRVYARQPEIQNYLERCARKHDVIPHVRFGVAVETARWDEAESVWRLTLSDRSESTASVLISGVGQLHRPYIPRLPGLDDFSGVRFHSARWNHAHDLTGRRVAVVGSAASAIQFIPQVAEGAEKVTVFQRSANWILPRNDREYSPWQRWVFRNVPFTARLTRSAQFLQHEVCFAMIRRGNWFDRFFAEQVERRARRHLHRNIADPRLRQVLRPDSELGCKRVLISDDFYQALARPNVEVVTEPIAHLQSAGLTTADGRFYDADTLIFATGFEAARLLEPIRVVGRDGRSLQDAWKHGAEAYLGVAAAGFPNLFFLYGPNTNLGHNSILFMIECQANYVLQCLRRMERERLSWIDVRADVQADFNERLQSGLRSSAWQSGCASWYKADSGKITNNWSGQAIEYWRRTRSPDVAAFDTSADSQTRRRRAAA